MKPRTYHPGDKVRYLGGSYRNVDKLVDGRVYTVSDRVSTDSLANFEIVLDEVEDEYGPCGWLFNDEHFQAADDPIRAVNDAVGDYDRAMRGI